MEWSKAKETFAELKASNRSQKLLLCALLVILVCETCFLFTKETVVIVHPWTLTADARIESKSASRSYKEAWALAVAEMLGNITPGNVDFVIERLKPLLSPKIYNDVIRQATEQAIFLKEDRITQRFEPRSVEFEKSSDKVFVRGFAYVSTASTGAGNNDKPVRADMTFEFQIDIASYMPVIKDLNFYAGASQTAKVLHKQEKEQERQREKELKQAREDK